VHLPSAAGEVPLAIEEKLVAAAMFRQDEEAMIL